MHCEFIVLIFTFHERYVAYGVKQEDFLEGEVMQGGGAERRSFADVITLTALDNN